MVFSTNGLYNNGPFQAGVAYELHNKLRRRRLPAACPTCQTGLQDQRSRSAAVLASASGKLAAVYEALKYDIGDRQRRPEAQHWGVSMTANLGPGQLYAGYLERRTTAAARDAGRMGHLTVRQRDPSHGPRVGGVTEGSETGTNSTKFSYTYPLSKRTLLYVRLRHDRQREERRRTTST